MLLKKYDPVLVEMNQNDLLKYFSETVELQGHNETLDIIYEHSIKFKITH